MHVQPAAAGILGPNSPSTNLAPSHLHPPFPQVPLNEFELPSSKIASLQLHLDLTGHPHSFFISRLHRFRCR